MSEKRERGQFFTVNNAFLHPRFLSWLAAIPEQSKQRVLEPFAGAGNITQMLPQLTFSCYDIQPRAPFVVERDTLADFPTGFDVAITNPPYLYRSSASRTKTPFPDTTFEDLYEFCLFKCLENVKFLAAIVPASFMLLSADARLTSRLKTVIELNEEMFADTETPVCLALFGDAEGDSVGDIMYVRGEIEVSRAALERASQPLKARLDKKLVKMNSAAGTVVLRGIDTAGGVRAHFTRAGNIPFNSTTRSITHCKIPDDMTDAMLDDLIDEANALLNKWREDTHDFLLLAFRGLRTDGEFRRRVDFNTARAVLCAAYANLRELT